MKKFWSFLFILGVVIVFFWQFLFKGLLPIPSDTIVGLYYPFREAYFKTNPNGLPFKNFLITDPVRQQIPWRELAINAEKSLTLPIWNPYNFTGTPLLANSQSAVFYPFNIIFFVLPFGISWSFLILLEPLLGGLFLYLYLRNLKQREVSSLLGAISFSFGGFFVSWLEWGTIINVAIWLPLLLLSIDKLLELKDLRKRLLWSFIFLFSFVSSFFAGHLQTFFYLSLFTVIYFFARWFQNGKNLKKLLLFVLLGVIAVILSTPVLIPLIKFILLSARNFNNLNWTNPEWFIPWQNLIQFVAPDFLGNPSTMNYYGIWNYGEFVGYIGILPLVMAIYAMFFRRDKKTFLFGTAFFLSLIFALPTFFAKLPFQFNIPFISTSQPTRLLFITDFSLSILAALGMDYFLSRENKKKIFVVLGLIFLVFAGLWSFVLFMHGNLITPANLSVAKQNLILPTLLFVLVSVLLFILVLLRNKKITTFILIVLLLVTSLDLFRFAWKYEAFTNKSYLFPSSSILDYVKKDNGVFRVMTDNIEVFPPNFSAYYGIQTLDGYDPLYLKRYGEFTAAFQRGKPDIHSPFDFNRIITQLDPTAKDIDFLGVKYIISRHGLGDNPNFKFVFSDGTLLVYKNLKALPRVYFVKQTVQANSNQEAIDLMFKLNLSDSAVVENSDFNKNWSTGSASFKNYSPDKIEIETNNKSEGFLVFTDAFYPSWHATIDGKETKIYLTDYNFRGIVVPSGNHKIEFYTTLF